MKAILAIMVLLLFVSVSFGQNLLENGSMESDEGWEILYYNEDELPEYEFNYQPLEEEQISKGGFGGCLRVTLDDYANGQLLLYQRLTLTAGEVYRATGAIRVLEYLSDFEPVQKGPWYQFYVSTDEPDPDAGDFNPDDKIFDISAWTECDMWDFEQFNGLWEEVTCRSEHENAPYYVVPGEPGEAVDVTVGIKFGHWAPEPGIFTVLVDEIGFYPLAGNELISGGMESDDGWEIVYYNEDQQPFYEFNFTGDSLEYGLGGNLHIIQEDMANGQLLLYQRITAMPGEVFRATGAIKLIEYLSDFEPVGQGPWFQYYVSPEEPDPNGSDYNPPGGKLMDISAWNENCDLLDFERFQGLWESVFCVTETGDAPYYVVTGTPGEPVDLTVGIKFGHWGPSPGYFELLVDEVGFHYWGQATTTSVENAIDAAPNGYELMANYPNPFNPSTTLQFVTPNAGNVRLAIYDVTGRVVQTLVNETMPAGRHHVEWNATNEFGNAVPSGIYFVRMDAEDFTSSRKLTLLR